MQTIQRLSAREAQLRLDKGLALIGALLPVSLVVGNLAFEAVVALAGLGWIVRWRLSEIKLIKPLRHHPLVIPWIAWYLAIIVSLLINGAGNKGWLHDFVFIRYFIFGLALIEISQRVDVARYLVYGLIAGVIWAAINTLWAYGVGVDLLGKPLARYTGKLKEAARIGAMTAYAAPFFLAWGLLDRRLSQKLAICAVGLGGLAFAQVLHAHIRTDILASAAGIGFVTLVYLGRQKSWRLALLILGGVALCLAVFFLSGRHLDLSTLYDRFYYWKVAWAMWLTHPVFGVGVSAFQDTYQVIASSGAVAKFVAPNGDIFQLNAVYSAHNLVLMLLSSTGLVGLAAFVWLFVNAIRMIIADLRGYRAGLAAWPLVLFIIGLTGCNIYDSWYQALFAFFMAMIGGYAMEKTDCRAEPVS
jgi:O-antigen ligase